MGLLLSGWLFLVLKERKKGEKSKKSEKKLSLLPGPRALLA
jgi:hypothetical protein